MADHTDTTTAPAADAAPVMPASIDAELIALAAEFAERDALMVALGAPGAPDGVWESAGRDVQARWWEIVNRVIDLPAHTQAGWVAKASMIPSVFRDLGDDDTGDHKLALSLVRDLTGQAGPAPDIDLLAACQPFDAAFADMKAEPGDTEEDDAAVAAAGHREIAALDAVVAIPARTAAGQ